MTTTFAAPRYRLSPAALTQRIDEETVVLQLASEGYYVLDDVGTHMLTLLLETQDTELAMEQLTNAYDVDPMQVRADFSRIVDDLVAAEILVAD